MTVYESRTDAREANGKEERKEEMSEREGQDIGRSTS